MSTEAKNKETESPPVIFRKRPKTIGFKSRKRARNSFVPQENTDKQENLPRSDSNAADFPVSRNRLLERFTVSQEDDKQKNDATAERLDVGGELPQSGLFKASRKPFGPKRAPVHLRTSVRIDYQPDVCKDYKETGFCGFGDSCKFLHDRSDYKAGWQLDQDWATRQKQRREKLLRGEDLDVSSEVVKRDDSTTDEIDNDGLPFACFICRQGFNKPVMTLCEHYFCEDCALARMEKEGTCAVCKKQMRGTLNAATKLVEKLSKKPKY